MAKEPEKSENRKRVTIRDIAREAKVHFTTVGLALRGSTELPESTRTRIREIADRMGYRPDPMLAALNAYRRAKSPPAFQATIAWINNWPRRDVFYAHPEFLEYYRGATERAKQLGYSIEEFSPQGDGMTPARLKSIFKARNIEAVLLPPQPVPRSSSPLDCSEYATLAFGYSLYPPVFHVITNHHFHSMNMMLDHLQKLGYTRIGLFVAEDWDEKVENAWLGGLTLARWKNRRLKNVEPLLEKPTKLDQELRQWLEKEKPDVVLSYSQALRQIRRLGVRVPEQLGFASLSLETSTSEISGLYQNNLEIGMAAVDYLVSMIHSGERGIPETPRRILIESRWNEGSTLRRQ